MLYGITVFLPALLTLLANSKYCSQPYYYIYTYVTYKYTCITCILWTKLLFMYVIKHIKIKVAVKQLTHAINCFGKTSKVWLELKAINLDNQLVYVIVWLAVVFGINSARNAGMKIVIVLGCASHYYNFPTCITRTINSKYYSHPYCYRLIQYCCRR